MSGILRDSIIVRNAYKLIPLLVLVWGLSRGLGKSKSLFSFSYAVAVQNEVNNIARRMGQDALTGMELPSPEKFADYIHGNFARQEGVNRDQAIDMWGNPYTLVYDGGVARVISAGPDKKLGTPDDIVAEAKLAQQ